VKDVPTENAGTTIQIPQLPPGWRGLMFVTNGNQVHVTMATMGRWEAKSILEAAHARVVAELQASPVPSPVATDAPPVEVPEAEFLSEA